MKKIMPLVIMLITFSVLNVNAAMPPYHWTIDNGTLQRDDITILSTASTSWKYLENDEMQYVLQLNNYNGTGIKLECYGIGQNGRRFAIELIGENYITDDNIGIDYDYRSELEFIGDGTLVINAPTPLSYSSVSNPYTIKGTKVVSETPSSNEYNAVTNYEVQQETQETNEVTTGNNNSTSNNNLIYIIFGVYAVISLIIIAMLALKVSQQSKNVNNG